MRVYVSIWTTTFISICHADTREWRMIYQMLCMHTCRLEMACHSQGLISLRLGATLPARWPPGGWNEDVNVRAPDWATLPVVTLCLSLVQFLLLFQFVLSYIFLCCSCCKNSALIQTKTCGKVFEFWISIFHTSFVLPVSVSPQSSSGMRSNFTF